MKNKKYKTFTKCRFCLSNNIETILDLGLVPLAGGFIKSESKIKNEKKYPLQLFFCKECFLLQANTSINPNLLFREYFYFSSKIKTLVDHFKKNALYFSKIVSNEGKFVVEIGSNDGSFLDAMNKQKFKVLGVEPAVNVSSVSRKKGQRVINDYFSENTAKKIVKKYGKADLIFSSNTLAHIEDMHSVFRGISKLLKDDGLLVFEVHYLPKLIKGIQYDFIYHEHQYYYSLLSLQNFIKRFGLVIYDAKEIPIHGGSIQVYVKRSNSVKKTNRLLKLVKKERKQRIDKVHTYKDFASRIYELRNHLLKTLDKKQLNGLSIAGYGASGRGTVIMNYCKLDKNIISYVIDDAPAKIGSYMPGTHQKIVSSKILKSKKRPDYVVLFAWPFIFEILAKNKKYVNAGGEIYYSYSQDQRNTFMNKISSTILILGINGMTGRTMYSYMKLKSTDNTYGTTKNGKSGLKLSANRVNEDFTKIMKKLKKIDFLINCIGINHVSNSNKIDAIKTNSILPNLLGDLSIKYNYKLINISTDAVFKTNSGKNTEKDYPTPQGLYSISKYLGENKSKNTLNIRTSLIGTNPKKKKGLIEFVLNNKTSSIDGFTNQQWSGCTTLQFAKFCENIILNKKFTKFRSKSEVLHFAPLGPISKYDLISAIIKESDIEIDLKKKNSANEISRYLSSIYFDKKYLKLYNTNVNKAISELLEFERNIN